MSVGSEMVFMHSKVISATVHVQSHQVEFSLVVWSERLCTFPWLWEVPRVGRTWILCQGSLACCHRVLHPCKGGTPAGSRFVLIQPKCAWMLATLPHPLLQKQLRAFLVYCRVGHISDAFLRGSMGDIFLINYEMPLSKPSCSFMLPELLVVQALMFLWEGLPEVEGTL